MKKVCIVLVMVFVGTDFDLDDLREAYENYCKKEKLECIDAQEYLFQSTKCTTKQYEWIKNFCVVWDMVESKESE